MKDQISDKQIYWVITILHAILQVAMEALLIALCHVAMAQGGIAVLAERTNLNRESLYKTLSKKGNPRLQTLGMLLK